MSQNLPQVNVSVKSGQLGGSPAINYGTQAIIGAASAGTPNTAFSIGDESLLAPQFGSGKLVQAAADTLAVASGFIVGMRPNMDVNGVLGRVQPETNSGVGQVVISGAPLDDYELVITVVQGCVSVDSNTGSFKYSLDGGTTFSGEIAMPPGANGATAPYAIPGTGLSVVFQDLPAGATTVTWTATTFLEALVSFLQDPNGNWWEVTTGGKTGGAAPAWPNPTSVAPNVPSSVGDGEAAWTAVGGFAAGDSFTADALGPGFSLSSLETALTALQAQAEGEFAWLHVAGCPAPAWVLNDGVANPVYGGAQSSPPVLTLDAANQPTEYGAYALQVQSAGPGMGDSAQFGTPHIGTVSSAGTAPPAVPVITVTGAVPVEYQSILLTITSGGLSSSGNVKLTATVNGVTSAAISMPPTATPVVLPGTGLSATFAVGTYDDGTASGHTADTYAFTTTLASINSTSTHLSTLTPAGTNPPAVPAIAVVHSVPIETQSIVLTITSGGSSSAGSVQFTVAVNGGAPSAAIAMPATSVPVALPGTGLSATFVAGTYDDGTVSGHTANTYSFTATKGAIALAFTPGSTGIATGGRLAVDLLANAATITFTPTGGSAQLTNIEIANMAAVSHTIALGNGLSVTLTGGFEANTDTYSATIIAPATGVFVTTAIDGSTSTSPAFPIPDSGHVFTPDGQRVDIPSTSGFAFATTDSWSWDTWTSPQTTMTGIASFIDGLMTSWFNARSYVFAMLDCPPAPDSIVQAAWGDVSLPSKRVFMVDGWLKMTSVLDGTSEWRPGTWAAASRMGAISPGEDLGRVATGSIANVTASNRIERLTPGMQGLGFTTVTNFVNNGVSPKGLYFTRGRMFVPDGDDFELPEYRRVMDIGCILAYAFLVQQLNDDVLVDPNTGFIDNATLTSWETNGTQLLTNTLCVPKGNSTVPWASSARLVVSRTDNILAGSDLHYDLNIVPLAVVDDVDLSAQLVNPANG